METGEDVLASEESVQGGVSNQEGGVFHVNAAGGRDLRSSRKKKLTRKVSFPEDSQLVRALDPVDPWEHGGNHSNKEVIDAYRNTCSRLKIKPCEKLIKQLEACESFKDRIDVIDLRGSKLDVKNCEALEEVFRRVRTKTLDLENTGLDDDGAVSLLEMVEFYKTTCKLNLAYNTKIKIRGWQALSRTLKKTSCLEYLDIRNTLWTEQSLPLLGRSLRLDCCLTVLHMENANLSGRSLFLLASAVKFNHTLQDLFLGDNKLISSDGQTLGAMLKGNDHLQLLDLRNNPLQDMGIGYICEGLAEQHNGGLQTLVLWSTQLTSHGAGYLANALLCTNSLQTLNLGHNRLTNDGIHALKEGLLRNQSIQRLGLSNTRLSSEGIIALAEVIADSKTILRVDLRNNDPYVGGLMALSLALKVNNTLVRIDLDKELKKEPGMETTQRIILADIYGYCQRNKMQAKEHEERQLANNSQTEEGTASETESIHGVTRHAENLQSESQDKLVASAPPQLIQLENPPDIKEELKVLTADYPACNSRFKVTTVQEEDEEHTSQDSSSSGEELVNGGNELPLVDLSEDSNCFPKLNSTSPTSDLHNSSASLSGDLRDSNTSVTGELFHSNKSMSGSLRDQMPSDPLVNLDDSAQSWGLILQPNATPANLSVQTDVRSTEPSPSPSELEKQLDTTLGDKRVKERNHNPLMNNVLKTQEFWKKQMDDLIKGTTNNTPPPPTVSPDGTRNTADLLS